MSRETDIIEFVQGERCPVGRDAVLSEIYRLSLCCKLWSKGTYQQWEQSLDDAIASRQLIEIDGSVSFSVGVKPVQAVQLNLF